MVCALTGMHKLAIIHYVVSYLHTCSTTMLTRLGVALNFPCELCAHVMQEHPLTNSLTMVILLFLILFLMLSLSLQTYITSYLLHPKAVMSPADWLRNQGGWRRTWLFLWRTITTTPSLFFHGTQISPKPLMPISPSTTFLFKVKQISASNGGSVWLGNISWEGHCWSVWEGGLALSCWVYGQLQNGIIPLKFFFDLKGETSANPMECVYCTPQVWAPPFGEWAY